MNIKRGLFRLWLVCGLIFAGAVMFLSYDQIARDFKRANLLAEIPANGTALIPVQCRDARGALAVDYELDRGATKKEPDALCWYKLAKFRANFSEFANLNDEDLISKTYIDAGVPLYPAHPWQSLFGALGFALGVPLFFLLVGAAFVWAFSGFARTKPNA